MSQMRTLWDLLQLMAGRGEWPAIMALRKEDAQTWSYAELTQTARRLGAGLRRHPRLGLRRGEHVALFAANSPAWVAAALGAIDAGGVAVPIDVQMSDDNLRRVLIDSDARWLFTTPDLAPRIEKLELEPRPEVVYLDGDEQEERFWRRYLAKAPADAEAPGPPDPDDPAVLFYTSGTTGPPKGVPLTHRNVCSNLAGILEQGLAHETDRLMLPLPLHHVYPFVIGLLAPLAIGGTVVMPHALTGPQVLRALGEGEVTVMVGVPRFYEALFAAIETRVRQRGWIAHGLFRAALRLAIFARRTLGLPLGRWLFGPLRRRFAPRVRLVASGGAALDPDLGRKLQALGFEVTMGYGLTETAPILTFTPPGEARLETAGKPLPGVELHIDEPKEGQEHGEVLAKGPNVFAGYRNLPDKTREAFTDDGWFRTGDLGFVDRRGHLHLVGRGSEMIVRPGGENVNPESVEEALERQPHIQEAGVLQKDGQLVAVLVPKPGATREGEIEKLIRRDAEAAARTLASYQRLNDYAISRDPLPRTRLEKLQRHELEGVYERAKQAGPEAAKEAGPVPIERLSGEDQQLLHEPAARAVWDWLGQRFPDVRLTPDASPAFDLGVDSMEWLNLTLEMRERAGVDLPDEAVGRVETVRDLLREAADAGRAEGGGDPVEQLREPEGRLSDEQKRWLAPPRGASRALGRAVYALDWLLMRSVFPLTVEGLEHLPDDRPMLLAPNHTSLLDPPALAAALGWRRLRRTYWGGWTGIMFGNPLVRALSGAMNVIPVDPRQGVLASLALAAAVLKRGHSLVWFPEAERSPTGELLAFRPGVGMLLQAYGVTAVPVWIAGGHEALPRGAYLPRPHALRVVIGAPVEPGHLEREGRGEKPYERIANALHDRVAALARRPGRGRPGHRGGGRDEPAPAPGAAGATARA